MENEDIYYEAKKRVNAKKGFFQHAIAYAGVLGLLYAIMYFENNGQMLPVIIVALSWGIGLAAHYLKAFGTQHLGILGFNPDWEEEELEMEVEKLRRNRELKEEILHEKTLLEDFDRLELKEVERKLVHRDLDELNR